MGTLTQDMMRLCGEITALRGSRESLVKSLARETRQAKGQVSDMRVGFRKAHGKMAARTKAERTKFVSSMTADVSGMLHQIPGCTSGHGHKNQTRKRQIRNRSRNRCFRIPDRISQCPWRAGRETNRANKAFVNNVAHEVSGLLGGFHHAREEMGKTSERERGHFVAGLKKSVKGMREEVASDMAGARAGLVRPLSGRSARQKKKPSEKADWPRNRKARAEVELKAREEADEGQRPKPS